MVRTTAIASAIAALAGCAPGIATAQTVHRPAQCAGAGALVIDDATRQQASHAVLCLLNRERAARGASAVRASGPLAAAATGHSADMVAGKFFSHSSSNGDTVRQRVMRTGYIRASRHTLVGETIGWGGGSYGTPAELVAAFMESAQHRRTLLDRRYRDVGVGLTPGAPMPGMASGAATLTLDFGRR